jgi:polysaccharide export outer membrane protein
MPRQVIHYLLVLACSIMLSGCNSFAPTHLPHAAEAYRVIPATDAAQPVEYLISPLDTLRINVLYEPELSAERIQVAADGSLSVPLVGNVAASGKSVQALEREITDRLLTYVKEPRVSVTIVESVGQRVVVEGEVTEPGVYEIAASASLLEALARAKGPTRTAALNQIVVFRRVRGQRMGAVFDLRRIRAGIDADPRLIGGDTVVVGFSNIKGTYRDFLSFAPVIAAFRPY